MIDGLLKHLTIAYYANTDGADYHPMSLLKDEPPDRPQPQLPPNRSELAEKCRWYSHAVSGVPFVVSPMDNPLP